MNIKDFESDTGPIREIELGENKAVLSLLNDVDMNCSPDVRVVLLELISRRIPEIDVDMSDVPYMDSSGLATLVEALQRVKRYKGKLVLRGLQPRVRSVFEIAKLTEIFDIRD